MTTRLLEIGSIRTPYASIGAVPSQPPRDAGGDFRTKPENVEIARVLAARRYIQVSFRFSANNGWIKDVAGD